MRTPLIICWKPQPQHLGEANEPISRPASCHPWLQPARSVSLWLANGGRNKPCLASFGSCLLLMFKPHLTISEIFFPRRPQYLNAEEREPTTSSRAIRRNFQIERVPVAQVVADAKCRAAAPRAAARRSYRQGYPEQNCEYI